MPPRPGSVSPAAVPAASARSGTERPRLPAGRASGRPRRRCPGATRRPSRVPSHVVRPTPRHCRRAARCRAQVLTRRGRGTVGAPDLDRRPPARGAKKRISAGSPSRARQELRAAALAVSGPTDSTRGFGGVVSSAIVRGSDDRAALPAQRDARRGRCRRARGAPVVVAAVPLRRARSSRGRARARSSTQRADRVAVLVDDRRRRRRRPRLSANEIRRAVEAPVAGWARAPGRRPSSCDRPAACS